MPETTPSEEPKTVSAQVDMHLAGARVQFTVTVPASPVPPGAILPVFQSLWDAIEANVIGGLEAQGRRVSCGANCGACCRQLIPISAIEARRLAEMIHELPEPRRSEVRERFARAVQRMDEAGLLEAVRHPEHVPPSEREALGLRYFDLRIPCPFLEHESCSIHKDRPLICREFLVTSPPEYCSDPASRRVEGVKMPIHLSNILARFDDPSPSGPVPRVALPLLLEWVASHPDEIPPRPATEWVERLFGMLSRGEAPARAPSSGQLGPEKPTERPGA